MYVHLGRFESLVGRYGKTARDFVPSVIYHPEPPIQTRDALNPWAQERQRIVYQAEQEAWGKIQTLQREWTRSENEVKRLIIQYNNQIEAINSRLSDLGVPGIGFSKVSSYTSFLSFTPFSLAATVIQIGAFLEKGIDLAFGITRRKKKDLDNWIRDLQKTEAEITAVYQRMERIIADTQYWMGVTDRVKAQQTQKADLDKLVSEAHNQQRMLNQQNEADRHRQLVAYARSVRQVRRPSDAI